MGKTLTQYLKEIGEEQVTIIINGETKQVTRTEALARKMFLLARGGIEEVTGDTIGEVLKIVHKPDHRVAKSIREFTEGKAAVEAQQKDKKNTKPGRYDSEISRRLNERLGSKAQPKRPSVAKLSNKGTQT